MIYDPHSYLLSAKRLGKSSRVNRKERGGKLQWDPESSSIIESTGSLICALHGDPRSITRRSLVHAPCRSMTRTATLS